MKKDKFWGLFLIFIALYLLGSHLGLTPMIPFFTVAGTLLFGYVLYKGIIHRSFTESLFALGMLYCIYDEYMLLPRISNWIVIVASILLGCGLDIMLGDAVKKNKRKTTFSVENESDGTVSESTTSQERVSFENSFGATSKYLTSENFREAHIENNFGSMNVYLDNATISQEGAQIICENNFGATNLYLPKDCRAEVREEAAFGNVSYVGTANTEESAPVVRIHAESNFGRITIYFSQA